MQCLKTGGEWPKRARTSKMDVEELKKMVHVDDSMDGGGTTQGREVERRRNRRREQRAVTGDSGPGRRRNEGHVHIGLLSMAVMLTIIVDVFLSAEQIPTQGHLGLLMLALIVVAIMLSFPTAFTLMGLGMIFRLHGVLHAPSAVLAELGFSTSWCSAPTA